MFRYLCCYSEGKSVDMFAPQNPHIGKERLSSFYKMNYPETAMQSPLDLADAGFIYTGHGDAVQCVFCKVVIRNWHYHDKPILVHLKARPYCLFVQGYDVKNVPVLSDPVRGYNPLIPNLDEVCCPYKKNKL